MRLIRGIRAISLSKSAISGTPARNQGGTAENLVRTTTGRQPVVASSSQKPTGATDVSFDAIYIKAADGQRISATRSRVISTSRVYHAITLSARGLRVRTTAVNVEGRACPISSGAYKRVNARERTRFALGSSPVEGIRCTENATAWKNIK